MRDGLYRVDQPRFCAGFLVSDGRVVDCAPILRRRLGHWKTLAEWVPPLGRRDTLDNEPNEGAGMSDAVEDAVTEALRGSFGFSWKEPIPNDESRGKVFGARGGEAQVFIPFEVVPGDQGATEDNLARAAAIAKVHVFSQLGIDIEFGEDGIVRPKLPEPTATPAPRAPQRSASPARPSGGGGGGGYGDKPPPVSNGQSTIVNSRIEYGGQKLANPDWLDAQVAEACAKAGVPTAAKVWDERGKLPQYGGKNKSTAAWFRTADVTDADGNKISVWPPRGWTDPNALGPDEEAF